MGLVVVMVLAAVSAHVAPVILVRVFQAVGLGDLGPKWVELLTKLTEGLVILLVLATYVERRPFREIQNQLTALHHENVSLLASQLGLKSILRRLCGEPLGNLPQLIAPRASARTGPPRDAELDVKFLSPREDAGNSDRGDLLYADYTAHFMVRQPQYVIGLVNKKAHHDRLCDANAPIHEILVLAETDPVQEAPVNNLIAKYQISLSYLADERTSRWENADLELVEDIRPIWAPEHERDRFPLVLLQAVFPGASGETDWNVELKVRLHLSKAEGLWFWTAERLIYVRTITIHLGDLLRTYRCQLDKFLPNFDRNATPDEAVNGTYRVRVFNWALKGHGVLLSWRGPQ
jgi:hypothetical protein